jgi:hypothetical protein
MPGLRVIDLTRVLGGPDRCAGGRGRSLQGETEALNSRVPALRRGDVFG